MTTGAVTLPTPEQRRWIKPYIWGGVFSATLTAGRVMLTEVEITELQVIDGINFYNYATIAGNAIVGIYGPIVTEDTCAGAPLLAQSASTALVNANTMQFIPFASVVTAPPGRYYLAFEASDATYTVGCQSVTGTVATFTQKYDRGGGYGALTDPCPAVTINTASIPNVILRVYKP